ncbi:hypothetical protein Mal4_46520 [Maioricimonas rarisocia]|uniref:Uncharacterized protein n=1 Tax=Maioricimonas rarisocia TaxID=2528026 RepID=A0A517ZCS3_9PLAN|nr:hypothetical protein Mal4_46520 [Maioricimonas rarisocia]
MWNTVVCRAAARQGRFRSGGVAGKPVLSTLVSGGRSRSRAPVGFRWDWRHDTRTTLSHVDVTVHKTGMKIVCRMMAARLDVLTESLTGPMLRRHAGDQPIPERVIMGTGQAAVWTASFVTTGSGLAGDPRGTVRTDRIRGRNRHVPRGVWRRTAVATNQCHDPNQGRTAPADHPVPPKFRSQNASRRHPEAGRTEPSREEFRRTILADISVDRLRRLCRF